MKRRKFLIGTGSAAIGGSALLGSGAFSRVESQRSVTIQVAEDENAYLGLTGCPDSPNQSYTDDDGKGHLTVDMTPDNPTDAGGIGVNSDSRTWFHRVFQICNNGKKQVCVWIEDDDDWPEVGEEDSEEFEGDRRVEFYVEDDPDESLIGMDNAVHLPLGECLCVGIKTNTKSLSEGDELLEELDNEITIVADDDDFCKEIEEEQVCDIWGIDQTDPEPGLRAITTGQGVTGVDRAATPLTTLGDGDGVPNSTNYPNGLAHTGDEDLWYFADDDGVLWTFEDLPADDLTEYSELAGGTKVAGAAYLDTEAGEYHFIPEGGSEVMTADVDVGNQIDDTTTLTDVDGISSINLGDIAIDEEDDEMFVSAVNSNKEGVFVRIDLTDTSNQDVLVSGVSDAPSSATSAGKQIAFGLGDDGEKQLYAHEAAGEGELGAWYEVDTSDGSVEQIDETETFTDLAQCGPPREA